LVEQGLDPGEHVVLYPSDAVHDGGRVRVRAINQDGASTS
jgi:hypothetical protein